MIRKKIFPHEFIGKEIEILNCKNQNNKRIKGKIVDETKNTITINKKDGKKIILMKNIIVFKLLDTGETISGKEILRRPEDRIKGK
ncbi:MAG: ribonuclease P protein subunit [Nanoarchaeota archaeon]|nr:ribonuclease P protein subunit [Nanoarchaeota archaeon]MBU1632768.1 ribonuclease P protein subunit [Nanoarchaeota archaeon]MBU1876392.1 ribonuclease P protein subunit [Nanoarchaeota archaeon]